MAEESKPCGEFHPLPCGLDESCPVPVRFHDAERSNEEIAEAFHRSIDGDGGRVCAECGGSIITTACELTEEDGSQVRVCADCGAHGVRYFIFDGEDVVAGPVYGGAP